MGVILFAAMVGVPIVEIAVFIRVGDSIGLWPTLGTVVLTAIVGTVLLRHQGWNTLARVRDSLEKGLFPMAELFDGLCLLVAGALLLTPGFVTDSVGLLLFVPGFRSVLRRFLGQYLLRSGKIETWPVDSRDGSPEEGGPGGGRVIEGEFHEVPDDDTATGAKGERAGRRPPDRR